MKKYIIFIFSLCFLSLTGLFIYKNLTMPELGVHVSTSIPLQTINELIINSELIVRGNVDNPMKSKLENSRYKINNKLEKTITTDIPVNITEIYKGVPYDSKKISIRIETGNLNTNEKKFKLNDNAYPNFTKGEDVLLFLKQDTSDVAQGQKYYYLTGFRQGKLEFSRKIGDDLEFTNKNDYIRLSNFKTEMAKVLESETKNPEPKMSEEEVRKINEAVFGKEYWKN